MYYPEQYYSIDDRLRHDGIKGMKWHVRRYQNYDGTYTEEGKRRKRGYRESIRGNVANAAKKTGNYIVRKIKESHPSLMTKDELVAYRERVNMEAQVRDMKNKRKSTGRRFIEDLLQSSVSKFTLKTIDKAVDKMFSDGDTNEKKFLDMDDVFAHPDEYSVADVKRAGDMAAARTRYESGVRARDAEARATAERAAAERAAAERAAAERAATAERAAADEAAERGRRIVARAEAAARADREREDREREDREREERLRRYRERWGDS